MVQRRVVFLIAASLLTVGCSSWWPFGSSAERPRWPADAAVYSCNAGKQLVVRYMDGGKSVMVFFPEREFRLDQEPVATGDRYTNGRTTLTTKGDETFLDEGSSALYANCRRTVR
jgi:membrane-bound inhibitor of C-type lysozyme